VAALDADLAVELVVSMTAVAVLVFVVLLIAMLAVFHKDPESHIDADWPPPRRQ
jgi:hypothetical protein